MRGPCLVLFNCAQTSVPCRSKPPQWRWCRLARRLRHARLSGRPIGPALPPRECALLRMRRQLRGCLVWRLPGASIERDAMHGSARAWTYPLSLGLQLWINGTASRARAHPSIAVHHAPNAVAVSVACSLLVSNPFAICRRRVAVKLPLPGDLGRSIFAWRANGVCCGTICSS